MKNKLQEILNGWKNYTFKTPKVERLAKERLEICVSCKIKDRPGMTSYNTCRVCGCYVSAKVRSEKSSCPLGKW